MIEVLALFAPAFAGAACFVAGMLVRDVAHETRRRRARARVRYVADVSGRVHWETTDGLVQKFPWTTRAAAEADAQEALRL